MAKATVCISWVTAALITAETCRAQETGDDGPLIGASFACIATAASALGAQTLASKKAGFTALTPRSAPPTSGPDFRFASIFKDRGTGQVPASLRVDAISTGLDVLKYIDPVTGILSPTPAQFGIHFTIEPEPPAARTTSGIVRREDLKPDGAGADVFDYEFTAGAGRTTRDLDGTEIGLSDGTNTSRARGIAAFDLHLTAWDLGAAIVSMLPANPRVFFSVPTNAIGDVPTAWWPAAQRSGATILYSEWTGTIWSEPRVFLPASRLGLDNSADVDALAVEWSGGGSTRVVFSTRTLPTSSWNQLMFVELATDGDPTPVPVKSSSTTTTAQDAGVGSANVSSVCFWDPSLNGQGCGVAERWSYVFGTTTALTPFPPLPTLLASSVLRDCEAAVPGLRFATAGWTTSGRVSGAAVHMIAFGTDIMPTTPWYTVATIGRPTGTIAGDPVSLFIPLPPDLVVPDRNRCLFLWSAWVAAGITPSGVELAQSEALRIRL